MSSNAKEHRLEELEVCGRQEAREALLCVMHTILFCRAPGPFRPQTVMADRFHVAYSRVGCNHVRKSVERAVEAVFANQNEALLVAAGPDLLKGYFVISFFERRHSKSLFGFVSNEEKVIWEQWIVPLLLVTRRFDKEDPQAQKIQSQRFRESTNQQLRNMILQIHSLVNGPLDHVPTSMYEFNISCRSKNKAPSEPHDAGYARVILNPPLHSLSSL